MAATCAPSPRPRGSAPRSPCRRRPQWWRLQLQRPAEGRREASAPAPPTEGGAGRCANSGITASAADPKRKPTIRQCDRGRIFGPLPDVLCFLVIFVVKQ
ncbi:hypothetical protein GH733_000679 [Mirounga leonina]|nr:hypothetical protein GH733_000679 [Mirounga leonina]